MCKTFSIKVMACEGNHLKEELVGCISDLFLKYGLRSTSMDDMANHLKVSKKTLYQIFENKEDVVEQVMYYRLENLRKETSPEELQKIGPVRFLYEIKRHIIDNLNTRLPANYFDLKKYHLEVNRRIEAEKDQIMKSVLNEILSMGVEKGVFRQDVDMELQVYIFSRQMSFLEEQEMPDDLKYPVPLLVSEIVDNFIRAIATPKGIEELERIGRADCAESLSY